ncbi:MAG: class II fructose-bisphosphate aldolase [Candidatus Moranbacteria bacterium]|nr:class II fructose-bisphosphate aldolase [Candidatus Moranbacteria bacterium]NTW46386.1 class II fructose-bisphosphate aldolase [Candidatus Moranbacteria bacterium]
MILDTKTLLVKAKEEGYAVGAFNTVNLETTKAILNAAEELRAPVIVQITEKTMDYAGGRALYFLVRNMAEFYHPDLPVAIHLDHGKSLDVVERAIEIGFPSVMYDGSRHPYVDNVRVARQVVEFAHAKGVSVQGELGNVPYLSEVRGEVDWDEYMTDPDEAVRFVGDTGIDTLAVAIGNAHGFAMERPEPDYDRLSKISSLVSVPLVLHGASDWEDGKVTEVIRRGISCFNVDTAIKLAFIGAVTHAVEENGKTDIRDLVGPAMEAVQTEVMRKIRLFEGEGKAEGFASSVAS